MSATTGLAAYADIGSATTMDEIFDALLALIPDPDAEHGTGAAANPGGSPVGAGFLDEMSPGAAAQIRVELIAAKAQANNTTIT